MILTWRFVQIFIHSPHHYLVGCSNAHAVKNSLPLFTSPGSVGALVSVHVPMQLHRSLARFHEAWPLALGVLATAILKSYQEVDWKHSHFLRCIAERELVWLPTHWNFQQTSPFVLLVKFYQKFLFCPHFSLPCTQVLSWCTLQFNGTSQMSWKHRILG